MLERLVLGALLGGIVAGTQAEEIRVMKSNLAFPVPAQLIAELAAVQLKLQPRHSDDVRRRGNPVYRGALVASIIGKGNMKMVYVGFPVKNDSDAKYSVIMQYCEKLPSYEIEEAGLSLGSLEQEYQSFIDSNNMELTQFEDICGRIYETGMY